MLRGTLPPVSRRSTYIETLELIDDDTGDRIDLTGADITVEVFASCITDDYGFSGTDRGGVTVTRDAGGITVPEDGIIVWRYEAGALDGLSGLATVSVLISRDGDSDEVARLLLPIQD